MTDIFDSFDDDRLSKQFLELNTKQIEALPKEEVINENWEIYVKIQLKRIKTDQNIEPYS